MTMTTPSKPASRPASISALTFAHVLAFALVAFAAFPLGCYRPSIKDGGFLCADPPAKACPDDFTCVAGLCLKAGGPAADGGMCTSDPVTPVCDDLPGDGQACNPACQTNCACGRCNVVAGAAACTPPGTKALGQKCNTSADDCAAGLICLLETCGNNLGRCYRHCTKSDHCGGGGTICQIPILDGAGNGTGFQACDLAGQECNPIDNTGCPDPALDCYLTSAGQTLCDCPGTTQGMLGAPCTLYSDCAPMLTCVNANGVSRCTAVCDQTQPSCPTGRTCAGSGNKYGTCNAN